MQQFYSNYKQQYKIFHVDVFLSNRLQCLVYKVRKAVLTASSYLSVVHLCCMPEICNSFHSALSETEKQ